MRQLRTTSKLIVTVAPTGMFQGKETNPNFPILPEEIAQAAYDSWNEGASIVHIHARDRRTLQWTNDPDVFREIDARIREKNCDIIIEHTTSTDLIHQNVMARGCIPKVERINAIEMNPELASLDVTVSGMMTFGGKEELEVTRLSDIEYGAKAMLDRNVKPELEIFTPVCMEDVYHLIDKGLLKKPYWISLVMGMRRINRSYMSYSPKLLMELVDRLPSDSIFTVLGIGGDEFPAAVQSILLGGHLRVGFEDNVFYKKGQLAESNAQLVAKAVHLARELGCDIATPAEARQMLAIPPLG
jgi:uncharacterized protein (DUF849 family)